MHDWRRVPTEDRLLFSPAGFLLVDDFTGAPPIGPIDVILEVRDGIAWRETDREAVITSSAVVTYPGLGRGEDVTQPPRRYRVRFTSPIYQPLYSATVDGIEFDAPAYDDTHPPAAVTRAPTSTVLLPGPNYPFAPFIPVIRGLVEDLGGNPVPGVLVQESLRERTLTDERGAYSLALRWVPDATPTTIDAVDQRTGRSGLITITLPAAVNQSQVITIS